MSLLNEAWTSLNHRGLLLSATQMANKAYFPDSLPELPGWQVDKLRRALTAFDGSNETLAPLLDYLLQNFSGLPADEWQKAQFVESRWAIRSFTGVQIKPRRLWVGPNGETLPVFVPEEGASRQFSGRLGVGRSRVLLGRVLEWLRKQKQPLALVTNGRQWRLVHASQGIDAWCEWDMDLWFEEGLPGSQPLAWRYLLNRGSLLAKDGQNRLQKAISDSRKGQAELSSVLGERVRQGVEELITASHAVIETAQKAGTAPAFNDLYVAGSRIIMRCIITLFAEARGLLPVDNGIYQQTYGLEGLRQQLDRRAGGRGNDRLNRSFSAWPRMIGLFNLIYFGSSHPNLTVPGYGGTLFQPGDANSEEGISRALALLESSANMISDSQVNRLLRLLTRTKMKIRQGKVNCLVDAPVDFSTLSSEYIGILYEGLLDFELKQAKVNDPVIFLGVGNQPALPLSQLEAMSDISIKQLFEALKKDAKKSMAGGDDEEKGEEEDKGDTDTSDEQETLAEEVEENQTEDADDELQSDNADQHRAEQWLAKAAKLAGLVKKPRGRGVAAGAEHEKALARAIKQLCVKLIAPGQFYLVRWGGTRKGAGTFYTRPQLAAPTVRRTLQPLAYEAVRTETDARTGLDRVVEWVPKTPEAILALKVCDPAMGSGSFLAGALRYLTDALVESLYHHKMLERATDGSLPRMADGRLTTLLSDEVAKLKPTDTHFEESLRAQLKRHIVERCLYGVDLDPLAVELGRMALWIETMDRDLPFGFLDHKLKVGNALVGTWFDRFRHYPAMAWQREGGDKDYQKNKPNNLINHFYIVNEGRSRGKKKGDVFTDAIKARAKALPDQLIAKVKQQQDSLTTTLDVDSVHKELFKVFRKLHRLPVHESDKRAKLYKEQVLNNPHYHAIKQRMDLWCALWFWPGEQIGQAPLPLDFNQPGEKALAIASEVAREKQFFHWELEFPDVFTSEQGGFDAVLGNPPWETMQPNSKEFFSNHDPLYRTYGKQEALAKQFEYFRINPDIEHRWIDYVAGFKAFANWMNFVGAPFGDKVKQDNKGKKKHEINLGGRARNSFELSKAIHKQWLQQRKKYKGFADSGHPFQHQGAGKPYLQKMFLELSHALMRQQGRLGMIVPSGIYTDKGTTQLRELFLNQCDWQWLFGFENREGIFDIHRSFKFCPLIVQKGGETQAIRTAFMHRNVDDWERAEQSVLAYPRERVLEFSPYSKAILEIRSERDLQVLQKIYSNGVLLGDKSERGWGIKYQQGDFNMTSDSKLFPPRPKWEAKGYVPDEYGHWLKGDWVPYDGPKHILEREAGLVLSRDGSQAVAVEAVEDVALPLFQGGMIHIYDNNASEFVSTASAQATWQSMNFGDKKIQPQFLISLEDCEKKEERFSHGLKLGFRDIARNTDKRSAIGSLVNGFPCGNTLGVFSSSEKNIMSVAYAFSTIGFDWVVRKRLGGTHINLFVAEECTASKLFQSSLSAFIEPFLRLTFPDITGANIWKKFTTSTQRKTSWRKSWAVTDHERTRLKVILEAIAFELYGLNFDDASEILKGLDIPTQNLRNEVFCKTLEARGFWRIDKEKEPELRHTVLSLVAFHDLQEKGLDAFLAQNNGEGWMIPDSLRLADYGLGHDDRAQEYKPVASRLGPRFYDWQLDEDVERSWQECEAHAALIRQIVPPDNPVLADDDNSTSKQNQQGAFF